MLGHAPLSTTPLSAFDVLRSASITGSGGVLLGGAATTKRGRVLTASGGMLVSGAATTARGRAITGSGGLAIGGYGYLAIPHYLQLIVPGQRRNAIPRYETRRLTA